MNDWLIYGGGGHARVLADAIQANAKCLIAYFDDNLSVEAIKGIPVCPYNADIATQANIIIGIGHNETRRKIVAQIHHSFGTLIHPSAVIADDVTIGEGSVVLAGAVIQSGAIIGRHVVVNANVTIDHDAVIGDYCSIYPNAYIGGNAHIGAGVTIAACSVVDRSTRINTVFTEENIMELDMY